MLHALYFTSQLREIIIASGSIKRVFLSFLSYYSFCADSETVTAVHTHYLAGDRAQSICQSQSVCPRYAMQ
jgi:hypothetical protein